MHITLTSAAFLYALLAIPVLAALYLFVPQARRIVVGSLLFWQESTAQAGLDRSRRRRRLELAAVVLLAALAALTLALAGPELVRSEPTGPAGVLVVDRSASLLMTDGGRVTRLARLRQNVDDFLAALPADMPVQLRLLPKLPQGKSTVTDSASEVRLAASTLLQQAEGTWSEDELRRQAALAAQDSGAPVLLVTDVSPYGPNDRPPANVALQTTGGRAVNFALTGAGVTWHDGRPVALIETLNSTDSPRAARLAVSGAGTSVDVAVSLAPGQGAWTIPLQEPLPDRLTVRLVTDDDFAADNALDLMKVNARRYRIGLVGRGDPALLRFFNLSLGADVFDLDESGTPRGEPMDLTFFVDCVPPEEFAGPAVIVNPNTSTGPLILTERRAGTSLGAVAAPDDPVMAYLGAATVQAASHPVFDVRGPATVLLRSAEGHPLAVRYGDGGRQRVAVLFDLDRNNAVWSPELAFVVFWHNCVSTLAAEKPAVPRFVPVNAWAPLVGRVEGRQTDGPTIDQSAEAREWFTGHERVIRPAVLPLWPIFTLLAAGFLLARVWLLR